MLPDTSATVEVINTMVAIPRVERLNVFTSVSNPLLYTVVIAWTLHVIVLAVLLNTENASPAAKTLAVSEMFPPDPRIRILPASLATGLYVEVIVLEAGIFLYPTGFVPSAVHEIRLPEAGMPRVGAVRIALVKVLLVKV